jgi:uncharacterized protein (DUF885 family)
LKENHVLRYASIVLAIAVMQHTATAQNGEDPAPEQSADENTRMLDQIFRQHFGWESYEFPEEAMSRGEYAQAHRITDHSLEAVGQRNVNRQRFLMMLDRIDRDALSPDDQLNYDIFKLKLGREVEGHQYQMFLAPVGGRFGPQTNIPEMAERIRFESVTDYENYLARLMLTATHAIPQYIHAMQRGLEAGITPPRVTLEGVPAQFDNLLNGGLDELAKPFANMPEHIPADRAAELRTQFDTEVMPALAEAMRTFQKFFNEDYLPGARQDIAASSLPNGKAFYNFRLREMTTTDYTAEQIHEIGLSEVARIRAEMMTVIRRSDFMQHNPDASSLDDTQLFRAFIEYLRTDERFYCKTEEELLDRYRAICKEADPWLAKLFGHLPRLPYGVKEIPAFIAPHTTTAYYQHGNIKNAEPGWFYANTYALDQRPTYEMIPLALHEAVPGHHLQIAIAQELDGLPEFRTDAWFTAYGEGWALYAERLGIEMGMYEDPYDDFGRLIYEMWRACRLVVDPGMHALGWTREQAIQFMLDNTALSELNITNEVDRYIAWPGQATAYKIGEIKIRELRKEAESQLGENFDLRAFHDVVLGAGAIPLTVLEERVREWISGQVEN